MNRFAFTTATMGGSFTAKVEAMAAAGFTATELWARDLFDHLEGPEVALRALKDGGLRVSAFQAIRNFEGCPSEERRRKFEIALRMMDLAVLAESPLVTLAANVQPSASGEFDRLVEDLATLSAAAAQRSLRIAYEPIAWAPHVCSVQKALELIEAVNHPALGLQLDVFHAFVQDVTRIELGSIPPARLFLVELCDLPRSRLSALELSRSFRLFPGDGVAPLECFVDDLLKHAYLGDVVVEVFNTAYATMPPSAVAKRGWESLFHLFADRRARIDHDR